MWAIPANAVINLLLVKWLVKVNIFEKWSIKMCRLLRLLWLLALIETFSAACLISINLIMPQVNVYGFRANRKLLKIYSFFWYILRLQFSSVQFSCSVMSDSLQPHESQHARPPCPSRAERGSLLPLEMNACLPGCVWNATPRSRSPLERNIGFWTQA